MNIYQDCSENSKNIVSMASIVKRIGKHPSLQTYLQGRWVFNRTMLHTDNGSSLGSVSNATAIFAPVNVNEKEQEQEEDSSSTSTAASTDTDQQLLYREEGNVIFTQSSTSHPLPFYREYLYTFISSTEADVAFWRPNNEDHLKFFHTLSVTEEGVGETSEHLCIDDLYQATMKVSSDSAFSTTWVVDGPNKNYTITTEFTRAQVSTTTETDPYNGQ